MTSVSPQQYAPNYAYEMPPKSEHTPQENSAKAGTPDQPQSDSAPSRQPMTTPQRGQFSTHKGLVNSPPSAKTTDPAQLAQLFQENTQLKNKIKQVMAELTPIVNGLAQQIAQLKQQVEAKKSPTSATSQTPARASTPSTADTSGSGRVPKRTEPEVSAADERAPSSGANTSSNIKKMSEENKELHATIESMRNDFNQVVARLQQEIGEIKQKIGNSGSDAPPEVSSNQAHDAESASNDEQVPLASTPEAAAAGSSEQSPATQSSIDSLALETKTLSAEVAKMIEHFKAVIKELEREIVDLNQKVSTSDA